VSGGDDWFASATEADLVRVVRRVLDEGTARGQRNWARTCRATLAGLRELCDLLDEEVLPRL